MRLSIGLTALVLLGAAATQAETNLKPRQVLEPIAQDMPQSERRLRCFAFFETVTVLYAVARPFGKERDHFDFLHAVPFRTAFTETEQKMALERNYMQMYLDTLGGVDPSKNIKHPVFVADKATCSDLLP